MAHGRVGFATRLFLIALAAALLAATGVAIPHDHTHAAARSAGCGLTTLDGTIKYSAKIRDAGEPLECGPGQKLFVRRLTKVGMPGRHNRQTPLLTFFSIADVQLADEEAPARAEWSDKCDSTPFGGSGFRPHETMVPHLMNAHMRAASKIARGGGPVLGDDFSFAIGLGDLADNMQYNEIRWIIDLFDGNQLIDPDSGKDDEVVSGADGYDGVQTEDPTGAPNDPLASPVDGERILDLANEPFWAHGIRRGSRSIKWYTLPGNHDVKVQGTAPNEEGWNETVNEYNQGHFKITEGLDPEEQQRGCDGGYGDPQFYQDIFSNPAFARPVPADNRRRMFVDRHEWAKEHFTTSGIPKGHGYNERRCRDKQGKLLDRLCYSFTQGRFHFIGLDTNPDEGLENGNIDLPQWRWLKRELRRHSSFWYRRSSKPVKAPKHKDKLIVVFAHHPVTSMDNTETEGARTGRQFVKLLGRFPNVILNANGHTHMNRIWGRRHPTIGTSYWEVNTSAIADFPTQSRTIEIANNHDGTLSIYAVVFNADVQVDPRLIDWTADDHTHETTLAGADRDINEDWLASFGQEVLFYDPQQDLSKTGRARDRNVELIIRAPLWMR